ncbi:MAG: TolC family outer membrane protein [Oceanococcus sp.]
MKKPTQSLFQPCVVALFSLLIGQNAQAALLADLYAEALRSEPLWLAAVAEHEAAQQDAPLLRASMLPKLSLDGHYARMMDDTESSQFPGYEPQKIYANVWEYGVRLQQPLLDWSAFARLRQIDSSLALAELGLVEARADLLQRVVMRYFAWMGALDDLVLAREQRGAIDEQLRETRAREETGYATAAELEQLIAASDIASADELLAAARLRAAREGLLELTGTAPRFPEMLKAGLNTVAPEPGAPQHWVDRALQDNLALRQAHFQLDLAQEELSVDKSQRYPSLGLELEYNWLDNKELQLGREAETGTALLRLKVPLFSGGATTARIKASSKRLQAQHSRFDAQQRTVIRETRNAYDGVVTGIQRLRAARQSVSSSQSALEAVKGGWESGIHTGAELVVARKNLTQTKRDAAAARYAYLLSTVALQQVVGGLSDQDLIDLDARLAP